MADDADNFEMSSRQDRRRWNNDQVGGEGHPPAAAGHMYTNVVDAERRRQQLLQLVLIFSMLFIMLTTPNQPQGAPTTPSSDSSGAVPTSPMSHEYASSLQRVLQDKRDERYIYPLNASGIYRGDWIAPPPTGPVAPSPASNSSSTLAVTTPEGRHSVQHTQGKMFMQLRSLGIADVANFEFIYGVVKLYGAGRGSTDLLFPLQGVSIPNQGVMSLLSTPSKSHVLFLHIPLQRSEGTPALENNASLATKHSLSRRLSNDDGPDAAAARAGGGLCSLRERARGESSFLAGDSPLLLRELRAPLNGDKTLLREGMRISSFMDTHSPGRRRLMLSANDSAIVNWLSIGDTGLKIFLVDVAKVAGLPLSVINASMRRFDIDFYDRASLAAVGESVLPGNFKSLQSDPGQSAASGLVAPTSLCQFSMDFSSLAIGESMGDSARAQAAVESYVSTIMGGMHSGDCGFNFNVTSSTYHIKLEKLETKARNYSFMATAVCLIQVALLVLQLRYAQNPAIASKISIAGVCAHSLLDAALCVGHLLLCAAVPKIFFGLLIWISILKLFIFCVFEMRTLIAIYQARYSHELQVEGWQGLRRRLASLHLRFYGVFFVMLMLFSVLYSRPAILVPIFYSVWVPQIVHNAVYDTRRALHPYYVMGMSLSRMFIPLYFLWCPKMFLNLVVTKIPYTFDAGLILVVWTVVQVTLLLLQDMWGSRFFLPSRFQAHKYDYYRAVPTRAEDSNIDDVETALTSGEAADGRGSSHECVICYNDIALAKGRYMITPCEHVFHTECLKQWIEIKLECPVCRHALEPCDD